MITPQNFRDFLMQMYRLQKDISTLIQLNIKLSQQIFSHQSSQKTQLNEINKISAKVIENFGIINSSAKKLLAKSKEK